MFAYTKLHKHPKLNLYAAEDECIADCSAQAGEFITNCPAQIEFIAAQAECIANCATPAEC